MANDFENGAIQLDIARSQIYVLTHFRKYWRNVCSTTTLVRTGNSGDLINLIKLSTRGYNSGYFLIPVEDYIEILNSFFELLDADCMEETLSKSLSVLIVLCTRRKWCAGFGLQRSYSWDVFFWNSLCMRLRKFEASSCCETLHFFSDRFLKETEHCALVTNPVVGSVQ